MLTGRQTVPFGTRPARDLRRKAIGLLCAASALGVPACADIWGFADLGNRSEAGGIGGEMEIATSTGGSLGETGAGGALATDGDGGATGQGGAGDPTGSGGAPGLGAGGRTGAGGAPIGIGGMAIGVGGAMLGGAGGRGGNSGTAGTGGRGTGGVTAVGGATGTGGRGTGGAPACGPGNCANGCCAGTTCVTAISAQQCGHGGGACLACGGCQLCSAAGVCATDPASTWIIRCASARLTTAPPTGTTWDPVSDAGDGTAPDPFCQFERPANNTAAGNSGVTRTIADTFTPTWNQTITPGTSTITAAELMSTNTDAWRVWVGDNEMNGRGTLACQVRPPVAASALAVGLLTVNNVQNCTSLTLTLVCQR